MCKHGNDQGGEGRKLISTADQLQVIKEERKDVIKPRDDINEAKLEIIVKIFHAFNHRLFLCAKKMGSWMTIRGTMVTNKLICPI